MAYEFLLKNGISKEAWAIFINLLSLFIFGISINYFFKLCFLLVDKLEFCLLATGIYAFYPSNIYYIGAHFNYEKLGLPILIFVVYKLALIVQSKIKKLDFKTVILIALSIVLSCLFRPHLILIDFGLFAIFSMLLILNKKLSLKNNVVLLIMIVASMIAAHMPLIKAHHDIYGNYAISTRLGMGLIVGHNPFARGSWDGRGSEPDNEFYKYRKRLVPETDELDRNELNQEYKRIAINWILNNPKEEFLLIFRKLAIFFLPKNYEGSYNILNVIVHVLFLISIFHAIFHIKQIRQIDLIILSPVVFSVLLCIVFYVGYRWRFYAEPFMIIFSLITAQKILSKRTHKASF